MEDKKESLNKRQRKQLRQKKAKGKKTRSVNVEDGEVAIVSSLEKMKMSKEENEVLQAVLLSSLQEADVDDCDDALLVSKAIEMSLLPGDLHIPDMQIQEEKGGRLGKREEKKTPKRGSRGKGKRRRRTKDDDDYFPDSESAKKTSYQPPPEGLDTEDAALAAALNLSVLERDPLVSPQALRETEKATRKYRKRRHLIPVEKDDILEFVDATIPPEALGASPPSSAYDTIERRMLREQQDDEFMASLKADQEKERKLAEEERALKAQELKQQEEVERRKAQLGALKESLPLEPEENNPNCVTCMFRLPRYVLLAIKREELKPFGPTSGLRVTRRFDRNEPLQSLYSFVATLELENHAVPASFSLIVDFPKRNTELLREQCNQSLSGLGFSNRDAVIVQPMDLA